MKRRILVLVAMVAVLAAAACGGDDDGEQSSNPDGTGKPAELTQVTVGYIPFLIDAPFFVGIEKGYFADEGLELKLERIAGGADMLLQTAAGNFDIGSGGIGVSLFNAAGAAIKSGKEVPFEVVAPLHHEKAPVATPLVVSKERYDSGELTRVSDLKGKKVSINAPGASIEYWLYRALKAGGLKYTDVTVVTVSFAEVSAALKNKSIDGAMLGEPFTTLGEDQGPGPGPQRRLRQRRSADRCLLEPDLGEEEPRTRGRIPSRVPEGGRRPRERGLAGPGNARNPGEIHAGPGGCHQAGGAAVQRSAGQAESGRISRPGALLSRARPVDL
ncbi:MAG: ABC transporter substrate-binding protein [Dehalococcoidia bacterium]|nr:ABC transporter substrate-binding protein [Dehalococcoidia bacterium]